MDNTREVRVSPLYMGMHHLSPLGISFGTVCGGVDVRPQHGWSIEVLRECSGGGLRGRKEGGLEAQRSVG